MSTYNTCLCTRGKYVNFGRWLHACLWSGSYAIDPNQSCIQGTPLADEYCPIFFCPPPPPPTSSPSCEWVPGVSWGASYSSLLKDSHFCILPASPSFPLPFHPSLHPSSPSLSPSPLLHCYSLFYVSPPPCQLSHEQRWTV